MLTSNGEALLRTYASQFNTTETVPLKNDVYYFVGYGHSNATLIVGDEACILIDALDSDTSGERLRHAIGAVTDKPVRTLIYTHSHPDHTGGAGVFKDTVEEVIAFAPYKTTLAHMKTIMPEFGRRMARQFGVTLPNDDEYITQGIGPRQDSGDSKPLPVTELVEGGEITLTRYGRTLVLHAAPGETDDTLLAWLPEEKILCCGDNFYPCWPNLYAIRGSEYRDVAQWVDSLELLRSYGAEVLLPGHSHAYTGAKKIDTMLYNYAAAIRYVLEETLDGLADGKTTDELAQSVTLPDAFAMLPYLGEHYGSVDWSVRGIAAGYQGWFDGNPTSLHPLSPKNRATKEIALMGGADALLAEIDKALEGGEEQWALELCDKLLNAGDKALEAKQKKIQALWAISKKETSANGRHYYQTCAQELAKED